MLRHRRRLGAPIGEDQEMADNVSALPSFAEAHERALDRAVRRLPGFWTWDYVDGCGQPGQPVAVISPPWDANQEAFHVFQLSEGTFQLESSLEDRASGHYSDLELLLGGIRAVVIGDPFDASGNAKDKTPQRSTRETAKGRPIVQRRDALTNEDVHAIEDTLAAWEDEGFAALRTEGSGFIYASWDQRLPAFVISRLGHAIRLDDNLTINQRANATGLFSSIEAAMEAVRRITRTGFQNASQEMQSNSPRPETSAYA